MNDFLLGHEPLIRLTAFAVIFAVMAVWESLSLRRRLEVRRTLRWPSNLARIMHQT